MVRAKNYEIVSTVVKVIQKKTVASFSGHAVYIQIELGLCVRHQLIFRVEQ